jgi:hypothetical protein
MAEASAPEQKTLSRALGVPGAPEIARALGSALNTATKDPLEDRIRYGKAASIAARVAIALQLARILTLRHAAQRFQTHLQSRLVLLDPEDNVSLTGLETTDRKLRAENIQAFGSILYDLLTGKPHDPAAGTLDIEELYRQGLPPKLVEIVTRCTAVENHYSGFQKIERDLAEILGVYVTPEGPRRNTVLVASLGVLAAASALAWVYLH